MTELQAVKKRGCPQQLRSRDLPVARMPAFPRVAISTTWCTLLGLYQSLYGKGRSGRERERWVGEEERRRGEEEWRRGGKEARRRDGKIEREEERRGEEEERAEELPKNREKDIRREAEERDKTVQSKSGSGPTASVRQHSCFITLKTLQRSKAKLRLRFRRSPKLRPASHDLIKLERAPSRPVIPPSVVKAPCGHDVSRVLWAELRRTPATNENWPSGHQILELRHHPATGTPIRSDSAPEPSISTRSISGSLWQRRNHDRGHLPCHPKRSSNSHSHLK